MHDFVRSDLFALITGIASVIGTLLTVYQLRVNKIHHSAFRGLEWQKALIISLATGLFVAAGLKFYFQELPPRIVPLRHFHDLLHGTSGSEWPIGVYSYAGVGANLSNCYFDLVRVAISEDRTDVIFNVKPHISVESVEQCDKIHEPQLRTSVGPQLSSLSRRFVVNNERNAQLTLTFPSIAAQGGELMIWDSPVIDANQEPFIILHNDYRLSGTSAWGLLMILAFCVAVFGVTYDPFDAYKRKLIEQGKRLQVEHTAELQKILGKKEYGDLTKLEKQHYDRTDELYRRTYDVLFHSLSGDSAQRPSEHHSSTLGLEGSNKDRQ